MDVVLYHTIGLVLMVIRLTLLAQGKAFFIFGIFYMSHFCTLSCNIGRNT